MGKSYSPEELATRTFVVTMVGVMTFVVVVFLFIL